MEENVYLAGAQPLSDTQKILKGTDFAALSRARADVDSAEQQAAAIIAQAHEDAERIRAEALEVGMKQSSAYLTESAARVSRDLDALEPRLCEIIADALHRLLNPIPNEKQIAAAVRRALDEVDLSRGVSLIVAPAMLDRVQNHLQQFPLEDGVVDVVGDPTCADQSAVLRTPYGNIELDLEAQLVALTEGIQAALTGNTP